jgi:hypothetical protein
MGYSALGELFVYIIYFVLGIACIFFVRLTFTTKRQNKIWTGFAGLFFIFLLFKYHSYLSNSYKKNQLSQVGLYYLTNYPNCDSCVLELKENQTYQIKRKGQIIEQSNWHYEVGGDYFILYLDNDKHQLGSGDYAYEKYNLKYK